MIYDRWMEKYLYKFRYIMIYKIQCPETLNKITYFDAYNHVDDLW